MKEMKEITVSSDNNLAAGVSEYCDDPTISAFGAMGCGKCSGCKNADKRLKEVEEKHNKEFKLDK